MELNIIFWGNLLSLVAPFIGLKIQIILILNFLIKLLSGNRILSWSLSNIVFSKSKIAGEALLILWITNKVGFFPWFPYFNFFANWVSLNIIFKLPVLSLVIIVCPNESSTFLSGDIIRFSTWKSKISAK